MRLPALAQPAILLFAALAVVGCNRGGEFVPRTTAVQSGGLDQTSAPSSAVAERLRQLRRQGQFEAFVSEALLPHESSTSPELRLLELEALLASGRNAEAEGTALELAEMARAADDSSRLHEALKLWVLARFRQAKSLDDPRVRDFVARLPNEDGRADLLSYWLEAFRDRAPYRMEGPLELEPIGRASSEQDSVPAELCAIAARVNGVEMPTVFIDTGAQHTLLTAGAAREAGVRLGAVSTHLVGFAGLEARPGVIDSLQVGPLTLHDVPVLVGQSVPLVATGGQLTLGLDIMHQLRFTIDYPAGQAFVQPAQQPARTHSESWTVGVWTFPQACLCNVSVKTGSGRAIIDTGDRRGTFVSSRWARRHLTGYRVADAGLIFKFKSRDLVIEQLELGTRTLSNWPVVDTFPNSLERLDVADVLLGHDLLSSYVLTIDLLGRELQLRDSTAAPPDTAAISIEGRRQTGEVAE
ncbi:MAG TPA: retropepsin-like aspartic protease [Pirellulales bacterium]|jgi:hypothetical protein|nr:retropepsin-like aspartic protease [Pirellulales bacterium]